MKSKRIQLFAIIAAMMILVSACLNYERDNPEDRNGTTFRASSVEAPVFSPSAGTYSTDQSVAITSSTSDAVICYTDDGSTTPACNSAKDACSAGTKYSAAIAVAGDGTSKSFQAMACKSGMDDSTVASATITIDYGAVSIPQFSVASGTYTSDQSVTITTTTPDAVICYTDDGAVPVCNGAKDACDTGTQYSGAVNISATTTLKALACKVGYDDSTLATATYTKDTTAPTLVSSTPDNAATSVDPTTGTITLVFSENMDTSQTTHTLTTGIHNGTSFVSTPNSATFTWENATTLKIRLSWVQFPETSQIQWTLAKTNIKDAAGNGLAADITRTFTTKSRNTYFPIADTGQTGCYYNNAGTWTLDDTCSQTYSVGSTTHPQGQDAHYPNTPTTPAALPDPRPMLRTLLTTPPKIT